jgi:transcriptional regulator with XRE-family HTH domain
MIDFYPYRDLPLSDHLWMENTDSPDDEISPQRRVFGENIKRLMESRPSLDSNPKLGARANIGIATISRIINGQSAATLDTVASLAKAFGVEPWQLLVPNLDAKNPQILQASSPEEVALWRSLRAVIAKEAVEAQGADSGFGALKYTTKIPPRDARAGPEKKDTDKEA